MKIIILLITFGIPFCSFSYAQSVLSPKQFTDAFIFELKKAYPKSEIIKKGDLELRVKNQDSSDHSVFLDNAYDSYKQDPSQLQDIIARYVVSAVETLNYNKDTIDINRIVPIIKDIPWIDEIKQSMIERGAKKLPDNVFDDYNGELIIVYAEDSPKNIRYITNEDLKKLAVDRNELRLLAVRNLKTILPKIELVGGNGLFMMTAGGDYEASLLLFDNIWKSGQIKVQGDIVVAIPSRDLLLITGSKENDGLSKAKQIVDKAYEEGSYRLTKSLFVLKNGKFEKFNK